MAASVHEDAAEVGIEEGMVWLPSDVLDEAYDTKRYMTYCQQNLAQLQQQRQLLRNKIKTTRPEAKPQHPKRRSRSNNERRKLANGGSGMQAIFLESGHRPCGTGVFLPQQAGTNFQPTKKPACAPVLLPARVVQALNLNMHALGLQISPRQDPKHKHHPRSEYEIRSNLTKKKNGNNEGSKQYCGVNCQNQSSSPEIFLPKEWTY